MRAFRLLALAALASLAAPALAQVTYSQSSQCSAGTATAYTATADPAFIMNTSARLCGDGSGCTKSLAWSGTAWTFTGDVGAYTASGRITSSVASGSVALGILTGARLSLNSGTDTVLLDAVSGSLEVRVPTGGSLVGFVNGVQKWTIDSGGGFNSGSTIASGNGVFQANSNSQAFIQGNIANGGSAVGVMITNGVTLSSSGAKIAAFSPDNGATTVASVDKAGLGTFAGGLSITGAIGATGSITSSAGGFQAGNNVYDCGILHSKCILRGEVSGSDAIAIRLDAGGTMTPGTTSIVDFGHGPDTPIDVSITSSGAVQLNKASASKPTCNVTSRGALFYTPGAGGVADAMEVCAKAAADTYAWRSMATIP